MTNPAVVQEDRNITQKYRTLFNQGVERGGGLDHHERIMGSRDQFFRRLFIANVKKKKKKKKKETHEEQTRSCALSPTDRISYPAHRCRVV
jgi:hypothetical protein